MMSRFKAYLGVKLFERGAKGAILTQEGEDLYRRIADGFRTIETGLRELEQRRGRSITVTLSVSSAFTTHWLMPRIDRFHKLFPNVDLRFQLIAGSLRGSVENVDFGMRFVDEGENILPDSLVMNEIMLPVCSPGYLDRPPDEAPPKDGNTIIHLTDAPSDWTSHYPPFETGRHGPSKTLHFSDYAIVVQAALLSQGIAFGWITVASPALIARTLVPVSTLTKTSRRCVLIAPRTRPPRAIASDIRDWIISEMRMDVEQIHKLYPQLGILDAAYLTERTDTNH
jgi:DNA-binding transcriptional LysR family regulator